ncbi:MAG: hypothetical protein HON70_47140, partial [Lentisphaerae bacterium]|nr:hypothetical protein [Lentisphaerota bacterium]
PYELLSVICTIGGQTCPLVTPERASELTEVLRTPSCRVRFVTDADAVPHYRTRTPADWAAVDSEAVLNRKRDLDVLQRLGLAPGATVRSRYVVEWLFRKIETLVGVCCWDTAGWEGCPLAGNGTYETVREIGAKAVVSIPDEAEVAQRNAQAAEEIEAADHLYVQAHILMCICCDYDGGRGGSKRGMDELYELRNKMIANPDIPVTLVEDGLCMACGSCDGYDVPSSRCVHQGGLIRNFKKNLDAFQLLGLMPGDTLSAREFYRLLFEKIPSTKLVCSFQDGVVTSPAWTICGGPDGHPGYERTRENPFL